ncbi:MAG: zinc-binding dehydrogenase, partial [Acidobacteriota bacterium]
LECAGIIEDVGADVVEWRVGDRVMALLAGGGQAEAVIAPVGQLLPIPDHFSWTDAAAVPEAAITAWANLVAEGGLSTAVVDDGRRASVAILAATSGVGTFAVQLARELGAQVLAVGRSADRLKALLPLGADACLTLDDELPDALRAASDGGVDLIFDMVGGAEFGSRLSALRRRGTCVLVGLMAGTRGEIDLADVLRRRLRIVGSVLRSRSRAEKAQLVAEFRHFADERLADGRLRPIVDRVLPFSEIDEAYRAMERGGHFGKIVVDMPG